MRRGARVRWLVRVCAFAAGVGVRTCWADTIPLADPTRPPAAVWRALAARDGVASAAPAASAVPRAGATPKTDPGADPDPDRATPLTLSALRVGGPGGSRATVGGEVLALGSVVRGSRVVAIDPDGITLQGPRGTRRLTLTPLAMKSAPTLRAPAWPVDLKELR